MERAKVTEPFGYILKPLSERELEAHIEIALYKHQAETEHKKAEEALRESELKYRTLSNTLEEKVKERTEELKEAYNLLKEIETIRKKEIHHRIKNNLQVISSLLDLQAEKFIDKENITNSQILEAFCESQDRVISMALVHEELHKGGEIDTLNFSHYIKELAENLLLTYNVRNNGIILDHLSSVNEFYAQLRIPCIVVFWLE